MILMVICHLIKIYTESLIYYRNRYRLTVVLLMCNHLYWAFYVQSFVIESSEFGWWLDTQIPNIFYFFIFLLSLWKQLWSQSCPYDFLIVNGLMIMFNYLMVETMVNWLRDLLVLCIAKFTKSYLIQYVSLKTVGY